MTETQLRGINQRNIASVHCRVLYLNAKVYLVGLYSLSFITSCLPVVVYVVPNFDYT